MRRQFTTSNPNILAQSEKALPHSAKKSFQPVCQKDSRDSHFPSKMPIKQAFARTLAFLTIKERAKRHFLTIAIRRLKIILSANSPRVKKSRCLNFLPSKS